MTIAKINWHNLDDCHKGLGVHQVDWGNIHPRLKEEVIQHYKLRVFPERTPPKEIFLSGDDLMEKYAGRAQTICSYIIFALVYIGLFIAEVPLFMYLLMAIPSMFLSWMGGIVIGACVGAIISSFAEKNQDKRRVTNKRNEMTEQFIKDCRK